MANIQEHLNTIKNSIYGKEVRGAIHDSIKQCYDDASVEHDNANMEVKLARGVYNTLNDRLEESDKIQKEFSSSLDNKANKDNLNETNNKVSDLEIKKANKEDLARISNGSPLFANGIEEMTDTTRNYVNLKDGYIYIYDGSDFKKTSVLYQSTGVADGSITKQKVTEEVISMYPLAWFADCKHSNGVYTPYIKKALKNMVLFNADATGKYFVDTFVKDAWGNQWIISISRLNSDNTSTIICRFGEKNHYYGGGVEKVLLSQANNSNIEGYAFIDWSEIYDNGVFDLTYENTAIDNSCIYIDEITKVQGYYPFASDINLRFGFPRSLVRKVDLFNTDLNEKYYISSVRKGGIVHGNRVNCIRINKESDKSVVCEFNQVQLTDNNVMELVEVNNSGVNGYVVVDWSMMNEDSILIGDNYSKTGLSEACKIFKTQAYKEYIEINLPDVIYLMKNKEMNIYFENIINCDNLNNFYIDVVCDVGIHQEERWTYTPTDTIEKPLTINVYRNNELVGTSETTLKIVSDEIVDKEVVYLQIGDSLTDYNHYPRELKKLMESQINNVTFLGNRGSGIRHEGRSSWTSEHYIKNETFGGVSNPFFNPTTNKFDFSYYMNSNNYSKVTHVVIGLGTNDVAQNLTTTIENFKIMINSILEFNPNCKIGINYIIPPAGTQDGWGKLNKCWENRKQHFNKSFDLNKLIKKELGNYNQNVYLIPVNTNLNTIYGFPYQEIQVDSRNTQVIKRITENVHPSETGFYQMSDSTFYWVKHVL